MFGEDLIRGVSLLVATWAIESAVLRAAIPSRFGRRAFVDLFWINLLTNPVANFAYAELGWSWSMVEAIVVIAEIVPIAMSLGISFNKAAALSLLANGISAGVGLAIEPWMM